MKKILISILIVLLIILTYLAIWRGLAKIKSLNDIKAESEKLDKTKNSATELAEQTYPKQTSELDEAIRQLKLAKQEYDNKKPYDLEQSSIGALEVKTYKIHYLWTILGNYRKDEGVRSINLDLKSTNVKDVYDLQFTLVGNYVSITDFLYDIEDDEELKFEIKNLKIVKTEEKVATTSNTQNSSINGIPTNQTTTNVANTTKNTTTNTKTNKTSDNTKEEDPSEGGTILKATFTVQNIGITLD